MNQHITLSTHEILAPGARAFSRLAAALENLTVERLERLERRFSVLPSTKNHAP